jgi:hypothetical protein
MCPFQELLPWQRHQTAVYFFVTTDQPRLHFSPPPPIKNLQIFQTWLQFCSIPIPNFLISYWTKLFGTLKDWAASCMGTSLDINVYTTCFMSSSLHMSLTEFLPRISEFWWCAFNLKHDNKSHKPSETAGRMAVRRDRTRKPFETAASFKEEHLKCVTKRSHLFLNVHVHNRQNKKQFTMLTYFETG